MTTKRQAPLESLLTQLGFNLREVSAYLLLLELGTQPAALLARKMQIPKSTALLTLGNLVKRGYVQRTLRGRTQYFHVEPQDLQRSLQQTQEQQQDALQRLLPLLQELKSPYSSQPSVTFYEGVDGCRRAYSLLLNSNTEILEFGIHRDLVEKLGEGFMQHFIKERTRRNIFLRAIANDNDVDRNLQKRDTREAREQKFFSSSIGKTFSSIAIYEDKTLLLNLHSDPFGILIESREVGQTLRTIFLALWGFL